MTLNKHSSVVLHAAPNLNYENESLKYSVSTKSSKLEQRLNNKSRSVIGMMRPSSRCPYKLKCKNGPKCKNHDWNNPDYRDMYNASSSGHSVRMKSDRCSTQQEEFFSKRNGKSFSKIGA